MPSVMESSNVVLLNPYILFGILLLFVVTLTQYFTLRTENVKLKSNMAKFKPEISKNENKTFFLILFLTFATEDVLHDFTVGFKDYQAYVRKHEPYTLQFEMSRSDQSERRLMVIERYENKDRDYLETHRKSLEFISWRSRVADWEQKGLVNITGESFWEA